TVLHVIALLIAFAVITSLHIVLGEQAPKLLGLERAERVALAAALPMRIFYRALRWPVLALDRASAWTVRLIGLNASAEHASAYTEEELRHVIESSRKGGHIAEREQQLIGRIFDFSATEVREAMIPRTSVEAVPATATFDEARAAFRSSGYSRLPVYGEGLDDIVGLLFRKDMDMGQAVPAGFDLGRLARAPAFIPATATLGAALAKMQSSRMHFIFVVDEHGGTEGILTLEDLLEEIVGEIDDEFDDEAREQFTSEGETLVLDAAMSIRDANQRLNLKLPEGESYATVAGFLLARAGRMLQRGDAVEHDGGTFTIESVDRFRIHRVRFTPASGKDESPDIPHGALLLLPFVTLSLLTTFA
ncbi:MAG: hemolysin family protein, partial [Pyrinomonadaceae bacterium]